MTIGAVVGVYVGRDGGTSVAVATRSGDGTDANAVGAEVAVCSVSEHATIPIINNAATISAGDLNVVPLGERSTDVTLTLDTTPATCANNPLNNKGRACEDTVAYDGSVNQFDLNGHAP